jgi:hypothetical protein
MDDLRNEYFYDNSNNFLLKTSWEELNTNYSPEYPVLPYIIGNVFNFFMSVRSFTFICYIMTIILFFNILRLIKNKLIIKNSKINNNHKSIFKTNLDKILINLGLLLPISTFFYAKAPTIEVIEFLAFFLIIYFSLKMFDYNINSNLKTIEYIFRVLIFNFCILFFSFILLRSKPEFIPIVIISGLYYFIIFLKYFAKLLKENKEKSFPKKILCYKNWYLIIISISLLFFVSYLSIKNLYFFMTSALFKINSFVPEKRLSILFNEPSLILIVPFTIYLLLIFFNVKKIIFIIKKKTELSLFLLLLPILFVTYNTASSILGFNVLRYGIILFFLLKINFLILYSIDLDYIKEKKKKENKFYFFRIAFTIILFLSLSFFIDVFFFRNYESINSYDFKSEILNKYDNYDNIIITDSNYRLDMDFKYLFNKTNHVNIITIKEIDISNINLKSEIIHEYKFLIDRIYQFYPTQNFVINMATKYEINNLNIENIEYVIREIEQNLVVYDTLFFNQNVINKTLIRINDLLSEYDNVNSGNFNKSSDKKQFISNYFKNFNNDYNNTKVYFLELVEDSNTCYQYFKNCSLIKKYFKVNLYEIK